MHKLHRPLLPAPLLFCRLPNRVPHLASRPRAANAATKPAHHEQNATALEQNVMTLEQCAAFSFPARIRPQ
jgi:hypothetical protein